MVTECFEYIMFLLKIAEPLGFLQPISQKMVNTSQKN